MAIGIPIPKGSWPKEANIFAITEITESVAKTANTPTIATNHTFDFVYPSEINMRSYKPAKVGDPKQIKKAVDLILEAKKPVIYSGGGVIQDDASAELTELAKLTKFPTTNTLMGLGPFPGTDPQF